MGQCVEAGVGGEVSIEVGAKTDDLHGKPVAVTGRVTRLSDGKYEDTRPKHGGYRFCDGGTTAVLETSDDHTLVLTSKRDGNTSREQMYSVGIWPERYRVVVAKGVVSPRPAYQPIASRIILVNTPGVTTADMSTFTYRRRRKPLYPFEIGSARYEHAAMNAHNSVLTSGRGTRVDSRFHGNDGCVAALRRGCRSGFENSPTTAAGNPFTRLKWTLNTRRKPSSPSCLIRDPIAIGGDHVARVNSRFHGNDVLLRRCSDGCRSGFENSPTTAAAAKPLYPFEIDAEYRP